MSLFDIRTWADARSLLYTLTTPLIGWLVYLGVVGGSAAALWGALAAAVLSPALATANTVNGFRQWFYPVMGAGTAVLVGLGIFTDNQITPVVAIITALVGSAVAGANTRPAQVTPRPIRKAAGRPRTPMTNPLDLLPMPQRRPQPPPVRILAGAGLAHRRSAHRRRRPGPDLPVQHSGQRRARPAGVADGSWWRTVLSGRLRATLARPDPVARAGAMLAGVGPLSTYAARVVREHPCVLLVGPSCGHGSDHPTESFVGTVRSERGSSAPACGPNSVCAWSAVRISSLA